MLAPEPQFAPAKINLFLRILGRRADGYHLLDSLAVFAGVGDRLRAEAADDLSLTIEGPFAAALQADGDNLVLRAAQRLAVEAGVVPRGKLILVKHLPVASGIGGGSADAAAALRLLCRLWRIAPDNASLTRIATGLGADVPVCLANRAARMGGIGERLTAPPTLPDCGILLVNPGVAVATPEVFRGRTGAFSTMAVLPTSWSDPVAMARDLATLGNDLQGPAINLQTVIGDVLTVLAALPGCLLARMSGSGATCFGLFTTPEAAVEAATRLRQPAWWQWAGGLYPGNSP